MRLEPHRFAHMAMQVLVACVALLSVGAAATVEVRAPDAGGLDVGPSFTLFEDASGRRTVSDVLDADRAGRFASREELAKGRSLGYSRSAFWLRLVLRNPSEQPVSQMLEVSNARLSSVSLFAPDAEGNYLATVTGGDAPFADRPYPHRHFVFPLTVGPQEEQVLYLRVQSSGSLMVPVRLWARADFESASRPEYLLQGWYFGMVIAMVLFNLLLWLAIRDSLYLYYVVFVTVLAVTVASKTGLAAQYVWPSVLVWSNFSYYSGISLTLTAFYLFIHRMDPPMHVSPLKRILCVLAVVHALAPVAYWFALPVVSRFATVLVGVTVLLFGVLGVLGSLQRLRKAYFYLAAFCVLLASTLAVVVRSLGWISTSVFSVDGLQFGSAFAMLVLAFALADRFYEMRRDRQVAQRALVSTQRKLVKTLRASEQELARRVQERTVQLQEANARLEALSMVDGLTGIANRRHFDLLLHKEWTRLQRGGQPLALVMLDVDWFKRYNDHFGHQAGDECLRAVAKAISGVSRASDLVARYGGEEFAIIAPGTDGPQAVQMAQRACNAVRTLGLPHPLADERVVTLSCGAAVTVPGPHTTFEKLLGHADHALYEAKAQGRNRVVLAQPLGA